MELPLDTVIDLMTAMSTQTLRASQLDPLNETDNTIHNRFYVAELFREMVQLGLEQGIDLKEELVKARVCRWRRSEAPRRISVEEYRAMFHLDP